jgi:fructokinase
MLRIGIDLGGTKIEGIALDGAERVAQLRVPTPRHDYRSTIKAVVDLVGTLEQQAGASGTGTVGVGIPGALTPDSGLSKNANSTWLIGRPLRADLEAALGRPVRVANDANCFAMSEAADGAAAGAAVVFGVILGTGVGGGLVVNGQLVTGPNAVAGEWGHNPLPWQREGESPGPKCYCGRYGCIETFLSGPALEADYARETGTPYQAREIAVRAAEGDSASDAAMTRYTQRLARALAGVINILDPDVIVLGGGLSNVDRLYTDVPAIWGGFVFGAHDRVRLHPPPPVFTRLARARHGDASGVRGAAWLWPLQ